MKKVLIWDKYATLSNSGGPKGYMWNIRQYLLNNPQQEISFYSDIFEDHLAKKHLVIVKK